MAVLVQLRGKEGQGAGRAVGSQVRLQIAVSKVFKNRGGLLRVAGPVACLNDAAFAHGADLELLGQAHGCKLHRLRGGRGLPGVLVPEIQTGVEHHGLEQVAALQQAHLGVDLALGDLRRKDGGVGPVGAEGQVLPAVFGQQLHLRGILLRQHQRKEAGKHGARSRAQHN